MTRLIGQPVVILMLIALLLMSCAKKNKLVDGQENIIPIIKGSLGALSTVVIKHGQLDLEMNKDNEQWIMIRPESVPIDSHQLLKLWEKLQALKGSVINEGNEIKLIGQMMVKQPKPFFIELARPDRSAHRYEVLPDELKKEIMYIKDINSKKLYKLENNDWFDLEHWILKLPDRMLLPYSPSAFKRIEYRHAELMVSLEKKVPTAQPGWQLIHPKNHPVADRDATILLNFLGNIKFIEIKETSVWGKLILSRYGLHKPITQLTVWFEGMRSPKIVQFGQPEQEEGMLYAKYQDETKIVSVPYAIQERLNHHFKQIKIERKLISFLHLVNRIECHFPDYRRLLVKHQNQWSAFKLTTDNNPTHADSSLGKEEAEFVVLMLDQLSYEAEVERNSAAYDDYKTANHIGSLKFYTKLDEPFETLEISQSDNFMDYLFLKEGRNGKVVALEKNKLKPILIKDK